MMNQKYARAVISGIFVLLLMVPYGIRKMAQLEEPGIGSDREEALDRYGFFLEDVTEEAGIDFVHKRATPDEKLNHILPQISSVGASVSVADFNNDGYPDIYLTNSEFGHSNALYKNMEDGTFEDVAEELGVANLNNFESGASMGSIWGDYNNSGFEDLFVYRWGRPALFRNEEGRGFTEVTEEAGLPGHINANSAVWLDYNSDGHLDLFIGGYYHEDLNLFDLEHTRVMPDSYEYATNGGLNYLFRNNGDGTFTDVSEETGIRQTRRWTLAASAVDLTGNGYPDLVVANDYGVDEIYLNRDGNYFENAGEISGLGFVPKSGMSVDFGDILNQGRYAIYITNISEAGVLMQGNNLWMPSSGREEGTSGSVRYRNVAGSMGVEIGGWGYAGKFIDFNNDGNLDLYVANGYISDEPETDYWYDYSRVVGGNRTIIEDAVNWPAMNGRTFSGYQENKLWLNDGSGRFREVGSSVGGALILDSRAIAVADFFGTGSLDVVVANQNQPVRLFRNRVRGDHQWIGLDLTGRSSNRSAIGTLVFLYQNDGRITKKHVSGGDAFSSQSQRPVHFGLGKDPSIDKIEIVWPSGIRQTIHSPQPGRYHKITEPESATAGSSGVLSNGNFVPAAVSDSELAISIQSEPHSLEE